MTEQQPSQRELFDVAELPGRPMLHWHGKRPLREVRYYPAQLRERYGAVVSPPLAGEGWVNRLYWGDNLQVMAHLMREFRGKIKLIYIDPPFDSGADYRKRVRLRGTSVQTDLSVLEERQYTDIWSNDLYLQYMYERLILMRELLAEDGSIYLHCDYHRNHYLRCILDEIFGENNFRNEIVREKQRGGKHHVKRSLGSIHDTIFHYSKGENFVWNPFRKPIPERILRERYPYEDERGPYALADCTNFGVVRPNLTYEFLGFYRTWKWTREEMQRKYEAGEVIQTAPGNVPRRKVRPNKEGDLIQSLWYDVPDSNTEKDYPTQKAEVLLERVVSLSSNPGDLVADLFIGSGTTAAVAQKLGRRWIGADINLGAIHTTARRLARIIAEQQQAVQQPRLIPADQSANLSIYQTFEVYNVNHYEVFKNAEEARDIVLRLYGVEPLRGHHFFDGFLDDRWVKVVDLNRICAKRDIQAIFDNLPPDDLRGVVVLCAGHEYDVPETIKQHNLLDVPFEVRDILTDRKDVIFKRPPEARISLSCTDGKVVLTVERFYSPLLLQKLSLEDDPETIEDWRQVVVSVLIDPAYDGEVFHPRINDTPGRRDELVRGEYIWEAREYGEGQVAVKIVDVLDEEWFGVVGGLNH